MKNYTVVYRLVSGREIECVAEATDERGAILVTSDYKMMDVIGAVIVIFAKTNITHFIRLNQLESISV